MIRDSLHYKSKTKINKLKRFITRVLLVEKDRLTLGSSRRPSSNRNHGAAYSWPSRPLLGDAGGRSCHHVWDQRTLRQRPLRRRSEEEGPGRRRVRPAAAQGDPRGEPDAAPLCDEPFHPARYEGDEHHLSADRGQGGRCHEERDGHAR